MDFEKQLFNEKLIMKGLFYVSLLIISSGCNQASTRNEKEIFLSDVRHKAEYTFRESDGSKVDVKNLMIIQGKENIVCGEVHIKSNVDFGFKPFAYRKLDDVFFEIDRYDQESLTSFCNGWNPEIPSEIISAQDAMKLKLRDPDSAKFKNMKSKGYVVCGEVNAKNGYGGYSGFRKFIYFPDKQVDQITTEDDAERTPFLKGILDMGCRFTVYPPIPKMANVAVSSVKSK